MYGGHSSSLQSQQNQMRKKTLLAQLISSAIIQSESVEFKGRAAPFAVAVDGDDYAVISCAQTERAAPCAGMCAELWCDRGDNGVCSSATPHVVRVADRCANCEPEDLIVSRKVWREFSIADVNWPSVHWRCVDCSMTSIASSSSGIIKIDLRAIEESACPGSGNSVDDSLGTNENGDIYESSSVGSGYVSFSDLDDSTSVYIEGSFDAEVQIPSTASSNGGSKSNSSGEIDGTTSASDISTIKDTGSSESTRGFWSGSGSSPTDTKPPDGDEQKISLPIPSSPSGPGVTSTSREPFPSSPSSSSPVPGYVATSGTSWSISPMWDPSSSGSSTSISPPIPTSPANEGSTYPVGTVAAPTGNPEDNVNSSSDVSSDTSTTGNRDMPRTPTPSAIQPSSGSADKGSRSGNLSATSFVTKSPFFYASIILAIIGLVGVVVGYRAKQKRSHHDEMRAFRMSMRQSTRTATPANNSSSGPTSPRNLHSQTRFDTHSIVIL